MIALATATPDPAAVASTITSWPALAAYALGLVAIGLGQWRQHRVTKDVQHQVTNNGGSSLKDGVDRTERDVAELRTMLADHIDTEPARRRRTALTSAVLAAVVSALVSLIVPRRF